MNWNDTIFEGLRRVNHSIHYGGAALTGRAAQLLGRMESCLCSGDGLSRRTAFRAGDDTVVDRTLSLLGMREAVRGMRLEDGFTVVTLGRNPFGIGTLYFTVSESAPNTPERL